MHARSEIVAKADSGKNYGPTTLTNMWNTGTYRTYTVYCRYFIYGKYWYLLVMYTLSEYKTKLRNT
jgi:hypothetical protein